MDISSCFRGCLVGKCGLRIGGGILGWDLFRIKCLGLSLEV